MSSAYCSVSIMGLEQQDEQPNLSAIGRHIHERLAALEPYYRLTTQAQRYELWAENLGLYHLGHSSLDYRFRDAPSIYKLTHRLLSHLMDTLPTGRFKCAVNHYQLISPLSSRGDGCQWRLWTFEEHCVPYRNFWYYANWRWR